MSTRFSYKVIEFEIKLFGGNLTQRVQEELDRLGPQGWELVSVTHAAPVDALRLFLKKAD